MPPILQVCDSYVGIKESPPRSNRTVLGARYGENGVSWCAIAVCMAYRDAGMDLKKVLTSNMASTVAIMGAAKRKGWFKPAHSAAPTDIVCYHMPGGRRGVNHVGIVKSVTSTGIWAYEGNTSQAGSQYSGGAYLVKFRPWSLILGVVKVPFASALGYNSAPPPHPAPAPPPPRNPLPTRKVLIVGEKGRLVEIAQWELAVTTGAQFPAGENGIYWGALLTAIVNLGRILGKNWDGKTLGPDQGAAIDFLYLAKGHQPVLS